MRRVLGGRPLRPLLRARGVRRHFEARPRPGLLLAVAHERVEVESGGSSRVVEEVAARLLRGRRTTFDAWRRRIQSDLAQEGTGIEVGPRARPLAPVPAPAPARVAAARLALHAPVGPAAPAGRALAQALAVASFRWRDAFAQARQGSVEGVHDVRTLARRLRALLAVYRGVAPNPARRDLRALLDATRRAAGALRDLDVLCETVEAVAPPSGHLQGLVELRRALAARRRALRRELRAGWNASAVPSVEEGLLDLAMATRELPSPPVAICAAARLPLTLERALGLWAALPRPAADAPDEALHALRIAAKRVRYATESFAPALGRPAARFLERIRAVHDGLGRIHDAPAVRAGLEALRASLDGADPHAEALTLAISSIEAAVEVRGLAARRGLDRLLEAALGRDSLREFLAHLGKRAGALATDGPR
jgi:CHAD domain-containing protein